jgi:hypothetical protein
MSEWQPIETAPKDGTAIDIWARKPDGGGQRWTDIVWENGWVSVEGKLSDKYWTYTHWMPIPNPPKPRVQS